MLFTPSKSNFSKTFILTICLTTACLLLSCNQKQEENPDLPNTATSDMATPIDFTSLHLRTSEIEILETITGKTLSEITPSDLSEVDTISIVGNHISLSPYYKSFSKDGYAFDGEMYAFENDLGDSVSVLKYFTNLKYLGLFFCEGLQDISFIESMTNLEELTVVMSDVHDFSVLSKLDQLSSLEIRCTPIDTIQVSDADTLQYIIIANGYIDSLKPFEHLTNLQMLSVTYNQIALHDTDIVCQMKNIQSLEFIAPAFATDFLSSMQSPLLSLVLGGYDNMDLTNVELYGKTLTSFQLRNSDDTDLSPLDTLPASCNITIVQSDNCTHGLRTTEGADRYFNSSMSYDIFDWYYEN